MTDIPIQEIPSYTHKELKSDQTVRWCPGCGDYAILAQMQKTLPDIHVPKENIVFISGIGCSSRFPYYMNTYGIHSIHGRAPTLATGLKIANPDLSVWVVTGDGDGLSIGGNHLLHVLRRNVDLQILLFNNRIYGLTKGQYSPTSKIGHKTKSSPMGSIDQPLNPIAIALAAQSTFVARSIDNYAQHLGPTLYDAGVHKGVSFVEIYQNCVIFHDGAFDYVSERATRDDNILFLENGKPMIYGKDSDKGIRMKGARPEVVQLGNGITEDELLVHDETDLALAYVLAYMDYPDYPVPMGVFYRVERPTYEMMLMDQVHTAQGQKQADLRSLYQSDYTWVVKASEDEVELEKLATDEFRMAGMEEEYMDQMADDLGQSAIAFGTKVEAHEGLGSDPLSNLSHGRTPITVTPQTSLADAVSIMQEKNIGALIVVDEHGRPVGIFTEGDVLHKIATQVEDLSKPVVADFMTRNPDVLPTHVPIAHAIHLMQLHHYRHVPIVDENGIAIDVVSFRDVVTYLEDHFAGNGK